jgi:hypothetical protein
MVLVLDPNLGPGHGIQRGIAVQRGRLKVRRDALTRSEDVSKVRYLGGGHVTCLSRRTRGDEAAGPDRDQV